MVTLVCKRPIIAYILLITLNFYCDNLYWCSQLWDASTGMELADFRGHGDKVTCCALSTSGRFVVSSSEDNTVRVS